MEGKNVMKENDRSRDKAERKKGRYIRDEAGKKRGAVTGRDGRESGNEGKMKEQGHSGEEAGR
jgi:hypothetical protein